MIKSPAFEDALLSRPSNSQIKRLTVGDAVQLSYNGQLVWATIAFIYNEDLLGIWKSQSIAGLNTGDLLSFQIKNIQSIVPDETRMKLPPFMLVSHQNSEDNFVIHTKHPRLIALMVHATEITAKHAVWIDEPVDRNQQGQELLNKLTDWYFYTYVRKNDKK